MRFVRSLIGWLVVSAAGCATMVSGSKQKIRIDSTPPGATARVQDQTVVTPATVMLNRNEACIVQVSKPGYNDGYVPLVQKMNPWIWGNYLFGIPLIPLPWGTIELLPGMIVDRQTGAAFRLVPDAVNIALELSEGEPTGAAGESKVE